MNLFLKQSVGVYCPIQYWCRGWNCIDKCDYILFSKLFLQNDRASAGRIDRLNTPFEHLYYYYLRSQSYRLNH